MKDLHTSPLENFRFVAADNDDSLSLLIWAERLRADNSAMSQKLHHELRAIAVTISALHAENASLLAQHKLLLELVKGFMEERGNDCDTETE